MTRMFYDCPIKAAYMGKYFGVKLKCLVPDWKGDNEWKSFNKVDLEDPNLQPGLDIGEALEALEKVKKIYVHPESEHVFLPKEYDVGVKWDAAIGYPSTAVYDCGDWIDIDCIEKEGDYKIILRDNKHFFMPEVEE